DRAGGAELEHPGRPPFGSGRNGAGTRRLCQGQSGQGELLLGRHRRAAAFDRRMVQIGGCDRHRACPLSRRRPFHQRPCRRPSANDLRGHEFLLLPLIQSGKLRALATTSSKRIAELPDVPTMAESGFAGFVSTSWTGLLAPAHTPRDVIDKLNVQINEGLKSAELRSALAKLSNQPLGGTPQDFTDMIKGDIGKWAPIVKALGLTAG